MSPHILSTSWHSLIEYITGIVLNLISRIYWCISRKLLEIICRYYILVFRYWISFINNFSVVLFLFVVFVMVLYYVMDFGCHENCYAMLIISLDDWGFFFESILKLSLKKVWLTKGVHHEVWCNDIDLSNIFHHLLSIFSHESL